MADNPDSHDNGLPKSTRNVCAASFSTGNCLVSPPSDQIVSPPSDQIVLQRSDQNGKAGRCSYRYKMRTKFTPVN